MNGNHIVRVAMQTSALNLVPTLELFLEIASGQTYKQANLSSSSACIKPATQ
jgi:hypothetical protein